MVLTLGQDPRPFSILYPCGKTAGYKPLNQMSKITMPRQTLPNKRVVIMGLGLHGGGLAAARFFARAGARVLVTDLKTKQELGCSLKKLGAHKNITYAFGKHRKTDFARADLIIRNPAVPNDSPYLKIARDRKIPVHTDVSWFLQFLQSEKKLPIVIGITGTKGKSTTAALLHHVLTKTGAKVMLAGNIGKSPLEFIDIKPALDSHFRGNDMRKTLEIKNWKFVILELSSWHLESLDEHKLSPQIALITNILPDHLNRYQTFEAYAKTKLLISAYQTKHEALFINKNDRVSQQYLSKNKIGKVIEFIPKTIKNTRAPVHPVVFGGILAIARYLKTNKKLVHEAITSFPGLEGRLEYVRTIKGVRYFNDTCATQPDAAQFAIEKTVKNQKGKGQIVLIAGGEDKNLEYKEFARCIEKLVNTLILFRGSASDKILDELKTIGAIVPYFHGIASMPEAVVIAKKYAKSGSVVLLSPGAASFGLFKHEFDRGQQFKDIVSSL